MQRRDDRDQQRVSRCPLKEHRPFASPLDEQITLRIDFYTGQEIVRVKRYARNNKRQQQPCDAKPQQV